MELAALVLIAVLVWYYGHSLKVASEVEIRLKSALLTEIHSVKDVLAQVARNISDVEKHVSEIDSYAHSADVEWEYFNKQKIAPMLQKLDEIGALSVSLNGIHSKLKMIESAVDAIAAHPAFTWSKDDD